MITDSVYVSTTLRVPYHVIRVRTLNPSKPEFRTEMLKEQ